MKLPSVTVNIKDQIKEFLTKINYREKRQDEIKPLPPITSANASWMAAAIAAQHLNIAQQQHIAPSCRPVIFPWQEKMFLWREKRRRMKERARLITIRGRRKFVKRHIP